MAKRIGKYTVQFQNPPTLASFASVVSKKEGEGPLKKHFDKIYEDSFLGESSWEKAESRLQKEAVDRALQKSQLSPEDIDLIFAGDLLNQCIGSTYGIRDLGIPFLGLFGACSTMAESLLMASVFVETGAARRVIAATSSHFCSAERQFRYPLEYAGLRTETSQWTVTGSGAVVVTPNVSPPYIKAVCAGTIEDLQVKDANNMGAAMAPAAAATIKHYFEDTLTNAENYDLILTGDLGLVGGRLLRELLQKEQIDLGDRYNDCGLLIYDRDTQQVGAGGSGCGCSASVLTSYILPKVKSGEIQNLLFIATGALMSTTSSQQGESIPGIAHLIHISANDTLNER